MVMERRKDYDKMPSFKEMKAREDAWKEDWYAGINQVENVYDGYEMKCPVFYPEQSVLVTMFLAKTRALKKELPDVPGLSPIQIFPGVTPLMLFAVSNQVTDIGPYDSLMVSIPIKDPNSIGYFHPLNLIPGFEMIRQGVFQKQVHTFCWRIPDDSYISYVLGYEFFGMPKFAADVLWEDRGKDIHFAVSDDDGHILTLEAKKLKTCERNKTINGLLYFTRDKLLMTEAFKNRPRQAGFSFNPKNVKLELGRDHPMAQELRRVLISTKAFY